MNRISGIIAGLNATIESKSKLLKDKSIADMSFNELFRLTEIGILVEEKEYWEALR